MGIEGLNKAIYHLQTGKDFEKRKHKKVVKKTLFVKEGTKEYYKAKLKEFETRILELEKKLKKEKIKKVRCETCKKLIGLKRGESYDLEQGIIQKGQGRKKPLLSYCSRKCERFNKRSKR